MLSSTAGALFIGAGSASATPCLNECDGAPWPVQVIRTHIADRAPTETIALVYAKIEVVYNAQ